MSSSVSVVIPAYRAARTIGRALETVLSQTQLPEEVLVVDDGSPDAIADAVAPYLRGGRVKLIHKPNGGVASARNLGIDRSHGDVIAFLDADDYWESQKLERQMEVLAARPQVGLVACAYYVQEPCQQRMKAVLGPVVYDQAHAPAGAQVLEVAASVWTSTVVIRRSAVGQQRFDRTLEPAEDRDLWARIAASGQVYVISEPLATAVMEPESLSRSNIDYGYSPLIAVIRRHAHLLCPRDVRHQEAKVYRGWAGAYLSSGRPRKALRPAWGRARRDPWSAEAWWVLAKSACLSWASKSGPAQSTSTGIERACCAPSR